MAADRRGDGDLSGSPFRVDAVEKVFE